MFDTKRPGDALGSPNFPALLALARAAFGPGVANPRARPSAEDWLRALDQERGHVRTCPARPRHTYGSHLTFCPWCERAGRTGQDDFNVVLPPPPPPPAPVPEQTHALRNAILVVTVLIVLQSVVR